MAPSKPVDELYDIENDPFELNNLANDPAFAKVKAEMQQALADWRVMVKDQGVSDDFRNGGWPATYPTKSPEEWDAIVEAWKPWVYRKPGSKVKKLHPGHFILKSNVVDDADNYVKKQRSLKKAHQ